MGQVRTSHKKKVMVYFRAFKIFRSKHLPDFLDKNCAISFSLRNLWLSLLLSVHTTQFLSIRTWYLGGLQTARRCVFNDFNMEIEEGVIRRGQNFQMLWNSAASVTSNQKWLSQWMKLNLPCYVYKWKWLVWQKSNIKLKPIQKKEPMLYSFQIKSESNFVLLRGSSCEGSLQKTSKKFSTQHFI